jgi:hypothetical protein
VGGAGEDELARGWCRGCQSTDTLVSGFSEARHETPREQRPRPWTRARRDAVTRDGGATSRRCAVEREHLTRVPFHLDGVDDLGGALAPVLWASRWKYLELGSVTACGVSKRRSAWGSRRRCRPQCPPARPCSNMRSPAGGEAAPAEWHHEKDRPRVHWRCPPAGVSGPGFTYTLASPSAGPRRRRRAPLEPAKMLAYVCGPRAVTGAPRASTSSPSSSPSGWR